MWRLALIIPLTLLNACSGCSDSILTGRPDAEADSASEPDVEVPTEPAIDPLPEPVVDITELDSVEEATDAGFEPLPDCTVDEDAVIDTSHWVLTIGSEEYEHTKHVAVGHHGRIFVSVSQFSGHPGRFLLVEIDGTGAVLEQTIWEDVISSSTDAEGQVPHSALPLLDHGLLLAGTTQEGAIGGLDIWLAKLDACGTLLWQKALGGPGHDASSAVIETRDGGILVAAMTESWARSFDFDLWLVKLDSGANIVWQECMGGFSSEYFYSPTNLVEAPDGTIYMATFTRSISDAHVTWLVSLDATGRILWQKSLGSGDIDDQRTATSLAYVDDHLILGGTAGATSESCGGAWLVKMRPSGSIVWEKSYGSGFCTSAYGILPRADGGFIVSGRTRHDPAEEYLYELWLASLDPDGGIDWQREVGGEHNDGSGVAAMHEDGIVIVGRHSTSHTSSTLTDVLVARMSLDGAFSGTCAWVRDGTTTSIDLTTVTTITDFEARITDGVIVDAHSTFTDVDLPVTVRCSE
ncbi:MAG: hypothetical protein JRG91_13210 [Deltaproteobacteria bacterium]|nr:hypothetical protein [Deltaproteobacteria bacterium]